MITLREWWRPDFAPDDVGFQIQRLSLADWAGFTALAEKEGARSPGIVDHLLASGLVAWRGIALVEGEEAACTAENAARLPPEYIGAVTERIVEISRLSADAEKNLPSPSASRSTGAPAASTAPSAATANIATNRAARRRRSSKSQA